MIGLEGSADENNQMAKPEMPRGEFFKWLHRHSSFYRVQILAVFAFIGAILEPAVHIKDLFEKANPDIFESYSIKIIDILQLIFIFIVITILNRKSFSIREQSDRYKDYFKMMGTETTEKENKAILEMNELNIRIFAKYWLAFWVWIFAQYLILFTKSVLPGYQSVGFWSLGGAKIYFILMSTLDVFLNTFTMGHLLICFILIQSPINSPSFNSSFISYQYDNFFRKKRTVLGLILLFVALHLFTLILAFQIYRGPEIDQHILKLNTWFKIMSGLFACCSLGLLIARLDSKIANVPSDLISVLILYAALQPLYAFFDDPSSKLIILFVLCFTLFFKIYFYIILAYIISTGRLSDLLIVFPMIKRMVENTGYRRRDVEAEMVNLNPESLDDFISRVDIVNKLLEVSNFRVIERLKSTNERARVKDKSTVASR